MKPNLDLRTEHVSFLEGTVGSSVWPPLLLGAKMSLAWPHQNINNSSQTHSYGQTWSLFVDCKWVKKAQFQGASTPPPGRSQQKGRRWTDNIRTETGPCPVPYLNLGSQGLLAALTRDRWSGYWECLQWCCVSNRVVMDGIVQPSAATCQSHTLKPQLPMWLCLETWL